MKKRIFSFLLALWMVVSLVPFSAFADDCGGCGDAACTVCNPVQEPAPQPEPQPQPEPKPEPQVEAPKEEPKPEVNDEPKEEPKPEVKDEPKEEEPKPEEKDETKEEEPKPEEKDETKEEEPKPEVKDETKEEPKPEEKDETKDEPKPEEKDETKDEPKPEVEDETKDEPKPEEEEQTEPSECICQGKDKCTTEKKNDCEACVLSLEGCKGGLLSTSSEISLTSTDQTITLTPTIVSADGKAITKVYDTTTTVTQALVISLGDAAKADGVTATANFDYDSAEAGNRTITASGIALSGTNANKYALSSTTATVAATITKAIPTITINATNPVKDFNSGAITEGTDYTIDVTGAPNENIQKTWTNIDNNSTSTEYPLTPGKYRLNVVLPETGNYSAASASHIFEIKKIAYGGTVSAKTVYITEGSQSGSLGIEDFFPSGVVSSGTKITKVTAPSTPALMQSVNLSGGVVSYTSTATVPENTSESYTVTIETDFYTDIQAQVTFQSTKLTPVKIQVTPVVDNPYDGNAKPGYSGTPTVSPEEYTGTLTCEYTGWLYDDQDDSSYNSATPPNEPGYYTLTITAPDVEGKYIGDQVIIHFDIYKEEETPTGPIEIFPSVQVSGTWNYTGQALKPSGSNVSVEYYGLTLKEGTDYTLSYSSNTNAGTGYVIVKRADSSPYTFATIYAPFTISGNTIAPYLAISGSYTYTGSAITPTYKVYRGTAELPSTEYDIAFANNTNAGTATATVTPKAGGNYTFTAVAEEFTIQPKALTLKADGTKVNDKIYDGTTAATVDNVAFDGLVGTDTMTMGVNYAATGYFDSPNAGTRKATITVSLRNPNYTLSGSTITVENQIISQADSASASATVYVRAGDTTRYSYSLTSLLKTSSAFAGTPVFTYKTHLGDPIIPTANKPSVTNGTLEYQLISTATAGQTAQICVEATGLTNYKKVEITLNVTVTNKNTQNPISITCADTLTYGDAPFALAVSGGSITSDVTFTSSNPSILEIKDGKAHVKKPGTVTITATKAGDKDTYEPVSTSKVITIAKKNLTIKADSKSVAMGTKLASIQYTNTPIGLVNSDTFTNPTYSTNALNTNTSGSYTITVQGGTLSNADCYNVTYQTGVLSVVPLDYTITQGALQKVTPGETATFTSNADFSKFQYVTVDGSYLDPIHYNAYSGSTVVTLSKAYIKSLAPGAHSLSIVSRDGTATTCFTVRAATVYDDVPKTGDSTGNGVWLALALVALAGFAGAQLGKKYLLKRKDS